MAQRRRGGEVTIKLIQFDAVQQARGTLAACNEAAAVV
jgi:hypothetical protein